MKNWNTCDLQDINFTFIKKEEGKKLIVQHDSYIDNLTQLDLDCRCHKRGATLEEYLSLCEDSVRDFSNEESSILEEVLCEIGSELKRRGMKVPYVEQINLVNTTMKEENNMLGYTRGNTIYLGMKVLEGKDGLLERLLVHELFHIFTRLSPAFKKAMYDIIGYKVEDKFFEFPKSKHGQFISNPDVSNQVCFANLRLGTRQLDMIAVTFCPREYCGGDFRSYFRPYFLPIDENREFMHDKAGRLMVIDPMLVLNSYLKHIGRNTRYIVNPEEALAENFVIAVLGTLRDLPNPEIVDKMRETMRCA